MLQWERGRRSLLTSLSDEGLEGLLNDTTAGEQSYYRAQIRCAGRTPYYTYDRIEYFRDCLAHLAETRKEIRQEIRRRAKAALAAA